jgi:hypothetical protein
MSAVPADKYFPSVPAWVDWPNRLSYVPRAVVGWLGGRPRGFEEEKI